VHLNTYTHANTTHMHKHACTHTHAHTHTGTHTTWMHTHVFVNIIVKSGDLTFYVHLNSIVLLICCELHHLRPMAWTLEDGGSDVTF